MESLVMFLLLAPEASSLIAHPNLNKQIVEAIIKDLMRKGMVGHPVCYSPDDDEFFLPQDRLMLTPKGINHFKKSKAHQAAR